MKYQITNVCRLSSSTALSSLAASALVGIGLLAAPAYAQDTTTTAQATTTANEAPATQTADANDVDAIVITGSRIVNRQTEIAVPVVALNNEMIQQSGSTNLQDIVAQLPAVGQNLGRSNTNFQVTSNAIALINLRNLDEARTLVLINGRRSVGYPGSSAVDVNNIPSELVDRIEVVTGGASAIYGSEAIAGVVNFILKDKYEGIGLHAQTTLSDKGDAPREYISLIAGQSFAGDRGHIVLTVNYDHDHGLRSRNRSFSAKDIPNRSSFAQQGLFSIDGGSFLPTPFDTTYTFDAANNLKLYQGANVDGYNRNADRWLSLPVKRYQGGLVGNFEVTDNITAYVEGIYSHVKARNGLEPAATGSGNSGAPIPVLDPDFPGAGLPYPGIPFTNPFIPQGILDAVAAYNSDPANLADPDFVPTTSLIFRRRSNDIFDRSNFLKRDYWRGVGGVKGDISDDWHFDVYYEHSQTKDRTRSENVLTYNYGAALNAVKLPNGQVVCADAAWRAAGCVPINIFGFNTVSPQARDFLMTDPGPALGGLVAGNHVEFTYDAKNTQDVVNATITGTPFSLQGGDVSLVFGAEYRHEKDTELYDPYTNAGIGLGNQIPDVEGKFNVKEVFAEVALPILKDRKFAHELRLEGAARYADYSTVGGVWSYNIRGYYAPISSIRFRGAYAQATRAPNLGELFTPPGQTFPAIEDPCDQGNNVGDAAVINPALRRPVPAACLAVPGISASAATSKGFTYSTAQIQSVSGLLGGNPNLKAEKAHTITFGAVITPKPLPNFMLSVDYYHIKVKDAVGIISQQLSVEQCVANPQPVFCDNVTRDANGYITAVDGLNINTGSFTVAGIDVEARYRTSLDSLGLNNASLDFDVFWNHLLKQTQVPFPGADPQPELGQADCYQCGRLGTGFKNKVFASTTFNINHFSLNYRLRYYSSIVDSRGAEDAIKVPAYWYHDMQMRWDVGKDHQYGLYLGINNLFDKKPPIFADTNLVTWPGTQTVANTYDTLGRMLYAGIDIHF